MRNSIDKRAKDLIHTAVMDCLFTQTFKAIQKRTDILIEKNASILGYSYPSYTKILFEGICLFHSKEHSPHKVKSINLDESLIDEANDLFKSKENLRHLNLRISAYIQNCLNRCFVNEDILKTFPSVLHPTINKLFKHPLSIEGSIVGEIPEAEKYNDMINAQYLKNSLLQ